MRRVIEKNQIETDLTIGKNIFENVPDNLKPVWSGFILSKFDYYIKNIPISIRELYSIIENEGRWSEAHGQFSKIRQFLLNHKQYQPEAFLFLAENVAKVTYNASSQPAPFDADSGWHIPGLAMQAANYFKDDRLRAEVQSAILVFSHNKKFKGNLLAAKEFLIYKKIDEILWQDWDPIGINDMSDARDEYDGYVSQLFNLKKNWLK
jgi:hypothetical protein